MKRITDEQLLGEKGVNLKQSIVLEMGFTWHSTNQPVEAGIDGWVELRDVTTGEVANCWLAVQSKARSRLRETDTEVKYNCSRKELDYWMLGSQPVILVVSLPEEKKAWWVSVKDYFRERDIQNERTIAFDKDRNLLTPATAEEWKMLGSQYGAGTYFAPPPIQETLTSNLIKVERFASPVYVADTQCTSGADFRKNLREIDEWPPREWAFGPRKQVYSFYDLAERPWREVCDAASCRAIPVEDLAYSDSIESRKIFVRLLNASFRSFLSAWRMRHSKESDCLYFSPGKNKIEREHRYRSRKKSTRRRVVTKYFKKTDETKIAYYRHEAFQHRFLRFGDRWYLMVEPTYVFTTDGEEPDPYREEHLSKIKSIEGDAAILGKIVMFRDMLKDRSSLFEDSYPFLGFGAIKTVHVNAGIDDKAWASIKLAPKNAEQTPEADSGFGAGLFD